jgi:diguanylate cyclase (GGDEF)-like protein
MGRIFINNLHTLRQANTVVAIFTACISLYPVFIEKDFIKAGICLTAALIASLLRIYTDYKLQTALVTNRFIYIFTAVFYLNIMILGLYLGVWSSPDKLAVLFFCFLITALLFFINPPLFNLTLILCMVAVFIIFTILVKSKENWIYDIVNTFFAGCISLYFNWHISKLRMGLEMSANMLEEERNKYLDQSTIDELTQLNNRRDFIQTFHRYLSSYRTSDDWLCISISDIDFFKNYNDHYGHPKGDDCLRSVGDAFRKLHEIMGVYSARVGGEEFAMLWFEKDTNNVKNVVSAITGLIKEMKIPHEKSRVSEYITISMGVYVVRCGTVRSSDTQALYDFADKALYSAKGSGRNCAVIYGKEIEEYKISPEEEPQDIKGF